MTFQSSYKTVKTIRWEKTFLDLLSEIGGHLGLFVGVSLMTLAEIAEFIFSLCLKACKRIVKIHPKTVEEHNGTQQKTNVIYLGNVIRIKGAKRVSFHRRGKSGGRGGGGRRRGRGETEREKIKTFSIQKHIHVWLLQNIWVTLSFPGKYLLQVFTAKNVFMLYFILSLFYLYALTLYASMSSWEFRV